MSNSKKSSSLKIRNDVGGEPVSPRSESELSDETPATMTTTTTSPRSESAPSTQMGSRSTPTNGAGAVASTSSSSPTVGRSNVPAAGSRARKVMESDSANISLSGNLKVRFV